MSNLAKEILTRAGSAPAENIPRRQRYNEPIAGLQKLRQNGRYSDVTIYVGETFTQYKLHKIVICSQSAFFATACKEGTFLEGKRKEINLPDIMVKVFDQVVKWLYHEGMQLFPPNTGKVRANVGNFELREHGKPYIKESDVVKLFEAADFLGMQGLRKDIIQQIVSKAQLKDDGTEKDFAVWRVFTAGAFFKVLDQIVELVTKSELTELEAAIKPMLADYATWQTFQKGDPFPPLGSKMSALVIKCYGDVIQGNFCCEFECDVDGGTEICRGCLKNNTMSFTQKSL